MIKLRLGMIKSLAQCSTADEGHIRDVDTSLPVSKALYLNHCARVGIAGISVVVIV